MTTFLESINLRAMGFCGVDNSVSPELLQLISSHYTWVEWGILFRPDTEGTPRYPTLDWVRQLSKLNLENGSHMRLAGHLCGQRCQQVLEGDSSFVNELCNMGFGRVQINATAANNVSVDSEMIPIYVSNLISCMAAVPRIEWIVQANQETRRIWESLLECPPSNMSILFDESCGLGKLLSDYSPPLTVTLRSSEGDENKVDIPCGYAGGIGPGNINDVLAKVSRASQGKAVWVDMESSLRVLQSEPKGSVGSQDVFSVQKCFECIMIGTQCYGLPVSKFALLSI